MNAKFYIPLTDAILIALAQLVDDAQKARRDPSHYDIESQIKRAGLTDGDPTSQGQNVGKTKRVRAVLSWAIENNTAAGSEFVHLFLGLLRGLGGFREESQNYVGKDPIANAVKVFDSEGYELTLDGELRTKMLENLSGAQLTDALKAYIRRAKRGADDAALVTGTSKDLLEAVAAHILQQRYGTYAPTSDFPTLLGQVFIELALATPQSLPQPGEQANKRVERAMYELACGINQLRNRQGTGHGRPWLPTVTPAEARMAIESMGTIAERLLNLHLGVK